MKRLIVVLLLAITASSCETTDSGGRPPREETAGPSGDSRDDGAAPSRRGSGGGLWNMLDDARRTKTARMAANAERRGGIEANLARGRASVPEEERRKMVAWWREFVEGKPEWVQSRHAWRALGRDANEILVENLLFIMVRAFEVNKGPLFKRARSELYESAEYSIPYLVAGLADNRGDTVIRRHLVELVGLIGKGALPEISSEYPAASTPAKLDLVRAASSMAEHGAPESLAFFRRVLGEAGDFRLRLAAIQGLGKAGHPDGIPVLLVCLREEDVSVRKFAAGSLGHYRDDRVVEGLIAAATLAEGRMAPGNREVEVVENCVKALWQCTDRRFKRSRDWNDWWRRKQGK